MPVEFTLPTRRPQRARFVAWCIMAWLIAARSHCLASEAVELTWDPSPNSDIVAYHVYYGTASGVYTHTLTFSDLSEVIVPGLEPGEAYYFAVSAIDGNGVESDLSNEAYYLAPVPNPIELQAQLAVASPDVELTWSPDPSGLIVAYLVYYGTESGIYTNSSPIPASSGMMISDLAPGETYYFAVTSIDVYGDESGFSTEASAVIPNPKPILLQTQTYSDGHGRPYLMRINTGSVVSGYWQMDFSTDLQNWTFYTAGYGLGNGDGYDVNVFVPVDPNQSQMFYRLVSY